MKETRRKSIKKIGAGMLAIPAIGGISGLVSACGGAKTGGEASSESSGGGSSEQAASLFFDISLAQWSLNKAFFGRGGAEKRDPMDFPTIAKNEFGINAIEYVNQFYMGMDGGFVQELKKRCDDAGVQSLLIMCDREGNLGDLDEAARIQAVENHYKWVDAAKELGCHSIRVNAAGQGTADEVKAAAIDGLGRLTEYGEQNSINVIVENHGGYSSDGQWLSSVISQVGSNYCGTLPDFGNFCMEYGENGCANEYDRYKGMEELMPYAKGVSAKANAFDADGNETRTDFTRMLQIVKDAGFKGYIGIEYEGSELSEADGIMATKALLEKVGKAMA